MSHKSTSDRDRVSFWPLLLDASLAKKQGLEAILQRQRTRLAEIVSYARANSPYYRKLYQKLPEWVEDPTLLPVTSKNILMPCFDDWVTDREVRIEQVSKFIDNPDLIGERFLDKYLVATTSGTSGTRGIFLLDKRAMTVQSALSFRLFSWLGASDLIRLLAHGSRSAVVISTSGHFLSAAVSSRAYKDGSQTPKTFRSFSVHTPQPPQIRP